MVSDPKDQLPPAADARRLTLYLLCGITLLGGILRFAFLSRPQIWGDEAKTFMRVCGTFSELRDALSKTDFAPLHYLLYWCIGKVTTLTPVMLRFPPALAGTLMVPAMYVLARNLTSRKTALFVALFTACSAYMLNYSRDAKMYAEAWLFVVLSTTCLFAWLRSKSWLTFSSWIICGILAVGLHALCAMVLAIHGVIFLSYHRVSWPSAWRFVTGIVLILAPLVAYYIFFIGSIKRIEEKRPVVGGIGWVVGYNRDRSTLDLLRYTASAYLYNWEWPRVSHEPQIRPIVLKSLKISGIVLLSLLSLGVIPWRRGPFSFREEWKPFVWIGAWLILPVVGFLLTPDPKAVWMPRYVAIIWPAFAILVCVLLLRLPTRPLRWTAIGLLLAINLVQHTARVFAGSEPPADLMARDVIISDPKDSDTRAYFRILFSRNIGEPGTAMIDSTVGRYYLSVYSGIPAKPDEIRLGTYDRHFQIWSLFLPIQIVIPANVQGSPQLKRIIVWEKLTSADIDAPDALAERLKPAWKSVGEELYYNRDHWNWRELFIVRRRIYERV